jgi:hypothetical protein
MHQSHPHLYFHSPCFDGIASAVLAWRFLETERGWPKPELVPVNYGRRSAWLSTSLDELSAVVDFHYHPKAQFWADHHQTTFLSKDAFANFAERSKPSPHREKLDLPLLVFQEKAASCAGLLWRHFGTGFRSSNPSYAELVRWADKIDAAAYDDPIEATEGDAPALQINGSLAVEAEGTYGPDLVRHLRESTIEEVALRPETQRRFHRFRDLSRRGLDAFNKGAELVDQTIVTFKYDTHEPRDMIVPRYAAYRWHPQARYSLVLAASPERVTIRANRNPWVHGGGVPLGHIFASAGGGGHQAVGAVVLEGESANGANEVFNDILTEIRRRVRVSMSESGR